MKTIAVETETRPVAEWLPKEDSEEIIYLTRGGRTRFVLVPYDEGDEEALAIQKNSRLMCYIAECEERAQRGPSKTLAKIKAELDLDNGAADDPPPGSCSNVPKNDGD
jgi:hypothetical protein